MQVSASPGFFTIRVYKDALLSPDQPDEAAFVLNRPAANTGALWDMFAARFAFFLRHVPPASS